MHAECSRPPVTPVTGACRCGDCGGGGIDSVGDTCSTCDGLGFC